MRLYSVFVIAYSYCPSSSVRLCLGSLHSSFPCKQMVRPSLALNHRKHEHHQYPITKCKTSISSTFPSTELETRFGFYGIQQFLPQFTLLLDIGQFQQVHTGAGRGQSIVVLHGIDGEFVRQILRKEHRQSQRLQTVFRIHTIIWTSALNTISNV